MNKKGVLGLDTVKGVILFILIISILAVVTFLVTTELRDSLEAADTLKTTNVVNGTTTTVVNYSVVHVLPSLTLANVRNPVCTVTDIVNDSGTHIGVSNYSFTDLTLKDDNCGIRATVGVNALYNNTVWNITYSYTYNDPEAYEIVSNITGGATNFFNNVPTFFILLGVVVLILIISIVIIAVSRFQSGGGSIREEL